MIFVIDDDRGARDSLRLLLECEGFEAQEFASCEAFLNAGGLGILVGDGQLPHPGNEGILETYYSFPWFASRITLDYQFIVNPAYNRDRGPVSVFGVRLHTQF